MIPPFQADMSFQNSKSIPNCPNNVEIERSLIHYIYRIYMIYIYELKSKKFNFWVFYNNYHSKSREPVVLWYIYVRNRYFKLDFTNYTNKLYIVAAWWLQEGIIFSWMCYDEFLYCICVTKYIVSACEKKRSVIIFESVDWWERLPV